MTDRSPDQDYITILPTFREHEYLVAVMRYRPGQDDYIQGKVSLPHRLPAAQALAQSWAAALGLEVRPGHGGSR